MQLGIWSAAGLEKMWSMVDMEEAQSMMPLLGITAIGHDWKIHISWKLQGTGETVSPIPEITDCLLNTCSLLSDIPTKLFVLSSEHD